VIWLVVALAIVAVAAAGLVFAGRRRRTGPATVVPAELAARLAAATRALAGTAPWQPAAAPDAPAAAAAIEAALIARDPRRALEVAEAALAASTVAQPAAQIWLAWALCASGQPRAALDQLAQAGDADQALALYLSARATHLAFEHGHGALGAVPPLITTGDLAVVTLGRGRGGAAWLTGATDVQLSADQVSAALAEHRSITARCLVGALDALDRAPGFADAAYLAARLAVKAGLVAQATALFETVAPRMIGRPEADAFERDRKDLADPAAAVAAAKQKPPDKGQRSRSLRVLT
jgi:hypothetical protein